MDSWCLFLSQWPVHKCLSAILWASNIEQLQGFVSVCRGSGARNSNHCRHKPNTAYKAISTTELSSLYKPIISFPLVTKQAYVSWKNKKETDYFKP